MEPLKVINLCSHDVQDVVTGHTYITSGHTVRLPSHTEIQGITEQGSTISKVVYGEPTGLPDPLPNTIFIVSAIVLNALTYRDDLVCPGASIKDANNKIIGCNGLRSRTGSSK